MPSESESVSVVADYAFAKHRKNDCRNAEHEAGNPIHFHCSYLVREAIIAPLLIIVHSGLASEMRRFRDHIATCLQIKLHFVPAYMRCDRD